jgi:type I restriction enzyme M protein
MSNEEFRHIVDTARQILVGKLPNPQDQIDAITYALMYKFMNDIDDQSADLPDGKRTYFANEYEKYNWHALMKADGQDQLILYREAIEKMSKNPGIPELFREIFSGAMLKFNDPRTLRLFLKEMDKFHHGDDDDLGNVYEYLLSLMGSQGDMGQFRTPRHIIKFIVDVVDPDKNDNILDPACGTGGFLIEAYKHIRRKHDGVDEEGNPNDEKRLTQTELKKIYHDFKGFDIDPTMIRTARVNLYLHGFKTPEIKEHDTLTSEDFWNDRYDVILANPPFMSPKGGIQPHKKFGVQAKRAEVLFADYIASHLKPKGKAGFIVPEGIIFQTGKAYKELRKNLVEQQGLYAVVSLPAGVFNPYSGVKTSILFLDPEFAKTQDSILFVKVENDGLSTGAQRRPIDKNDLPEATRIIKAFLRNQYEDNAEIASELVRKTSISKNASYNLSGEHYVTPIIHNSKFNYVKLGDYIEYVRGVTYSKADEVSNGGYEILRANNIDLESNSLYLSDIKHVNSSVKVKDKQRLQRNDILICAASGSKQHVGKVAFCDKDTDYYFGGFMAVIRSNDLLDSKFLFNILRQNGFNQYLHSAITSASINNLNKSIIADYSIPLPPLEIQKEIVEKIENKQNAIDAARETIKVLERERLHFNPLPRALREGWPIVKLEEACVKIFAGGDVPKGNISDAATVEYSVPIYTNGLGENALYGYTDIAKVENDAVTISARGTIGHPQVRRAPFYPAIRLISAIPNTEKISVEYLQLALGAVAIDSTGNSIPQLTVPMIKEYKIAIPPEEIQNEYVAVFDKEDAIMSANNALIDLMTQRINDVMQEVWESGE